MVTQLRKLGPTRSVPMTLRESLNDGTLEWQRGPAASQAWRDVSARQMDAVLRREQARHQGAADWIGHARGKTGIIFGAGPQLKRITPELAAYLASRDDLYIAGVNALPWYCKEAWGLDPNELFDFVVAADAVGGHWHRLWSWDGLDIPKFKKKVRFKPGSRHPQQWPIVSTYEASPNMMKLYYVDSVTAALNVMLNAMATEYNDKACGGPNREWPIRNVHRADGARIILLGVEHNQYNHAYTDMPGNYLIDHPEQEWAQMERKQEGHRKLAGYAADLGAEVVNGASWSLIDAYPKVDAEVYLNIPEKLRYRIQSWNGLDIPETTLSLGSVPEVGPRAHHVGECQEYCEALARHLMYGDEAPVEPELAEVE